MTSMGSSPAPGSGYGGYSQKNETTGVIGSAMTGVSNVVQGVGSYLSAGASYLRWKGNE